MTDTDNYHPLIFNSLQSVLQKNHTCLQMFNWNSFIILALFLHILFALNGKITIIPTEQYQKTYLAVRYLFSAFLWSSFHLNIKTTVSFEWNYSLSFPLFLSSHCWAEHAVLPNWKTPKCQKKCYFWLSLHCHNNQDVAGLPNNKKMLSRYAGKWQQSIELSHNCCWLGIFYSCSQSRCKIGYFSGPVKPPTRLKEV